MALTYFANFAHGVGVISNIVIWFRVSKFGPEGISVPTHLLLALLYIPRYILIFLGPSLFFLRLINPGSLLFISYYFPFPLVTLYLIHTRGQPISISTHGPSSISQREKTLLFSLSGICLLLALVFNYSVSRYGGTAPHAINGGAYSMVLRYPYEMLWAFGKYIEAVAVWPQLMTCERKQNGEDGGGDEAGYGRYSLSDDKWLLGWLVLRFAKAILWLLDSAFHISALSWDPLDFFPSLFTAILLIVYYFRIFKRSPLFRFDGLPDWNLFGFVRRSFENWRSAETGPSESWSWRWRARRSTGTGGGEEERLFDAEERGVAAGGPQRS